MKTIHFIAGLVGFAVLAATPLTAQEVKGGASVVVSLGYNLDQPYKTTANRTNMGAEFGYEMRLEDAKVNLRPLVGVISFPGSDAHGLKTGLTALQAGVEVLIPTSVSGLRTTFGLTVNKWSIKNSGVEVKNVTAFPIEDDKGIKLGLRLGLEFKVTDRFAIQTLLQGIELGRSPERLYVASAGENAPPNTLAKGGQNAAFVQVGVKYSF